MPGGLKACEKFNRCSEVSVGPVCAMNGFAAVSSVAEPHPTTNNAVNISQYCPTTAAGQNISVQRVSIGDINAVITGGPCLQNPQAILVTPEPIGSTVAGDSPVAYADQGAEGNPSFGLTFGTDHAGTFTPQDGVEDLNVAVYCQAS